MQVRVEAALIVPAERVAIRTEPLVAPAWKDGRGRASRRLGERGRAGRPDRDGP